MKQMHLSEKGYPRKDERINAIKKSISWRDTTSQGAQHHNEWSIPINESTTNRTRMNTGAKTRIQERDKIIYWIQTNK